MRAAKYVALASVVSLSACANREREALVFGADTSCRIPHLTWAVVRNPSRRSEPHAVAYCVSRKGRRLTLRADEPSFSSCPEDHETLRVTSRFIVERAFDESLHEGATIDLLVAPTSLVDQAIEYMRKAGASLTDQEWTDWPRLVMLEPVKSKAGNFYLVRAAWGSAEAMDNAQSDCFPDIHFAEYDAQ